MGMAHDPWSLRSLVALTTTAAMRRPTAGEGDVGSAFVRSAKWSPCCGGLTRDHPLVGTDNGTTNRLRGTLGLVHGDLEKRKSGQSEIDRARLLFFQTHEARSTANTKTSKDTASVGKLASARGKGP